MTTPRLRSFVLVVLFVIPSVAAASIIVHGSGGDVALQSGPSIAVNAAGTILVAGYDDFRGFNVTPLSVSGIARSADGGTTWDEVPVGPGGLGVLPSVTGGSVFANADVKYDPIRDRFVYSSLYVRPSDGLQGVCIHYSSSDGTTWTGPIEVTPTFVTGHSADAERMDVNATTGRVLLTWADFASTTQEVRSAFSDDGGITWSSAVTIDGGQSPYAAIPRFLPAATDATSGVYVIWRNATTTRNIGCARSINGGATWSAPVNLDASSFPLEDQILGVDRNISEPGLAVDALSGRVYAVYQRNDTLGTGDIALRTFIGDCVAGTPTLLNSNPGNDRAQFYPWVTVDQSNHRVHVLWYDQDAEPTGDVTEVMHTFSTDAGVTWSRPTPLTDRPFHAGYGNDTGQPNMGDYFQAVAQNGALHAVFTATSVAPHYDEGQPASTSMITPDVNYVKRLDSESPAALRLTNVAFVESGCVANGFIDPGEQAAFTLTLENYVGNATAGAGTINGISATLSTTNTGVVVTSATSSYPDISALGSAVNATPFSVSIDPSFVPGTFIEFVLTVTTAQGTSALRFRVPTGSPTTQTLLSENFDGVAPGVLPTGWTSVHGAGSPTVPWTTSNVIIPGNNAAFHAENPTLRFERLFSPLVVVPTVSAGVESYVTLDFDLAYSLEDEPANALLAYDGLTLRITDMTSGQLLRSILAEAFAESIVTGTIRHFPKHLPRSTNTSYFQDMSVWSGYSGGVVHVKMKFPGAGMTGRTIQLRFEYTEDNVGTCTDAGHPAPCGIAIDNIVLNHVVLANGAVARPTATVSGSAAICAGASTNISAALTGTAPWNLMWSDGFVQNGVATSPATRSVSPSSTTTYTVSTVSDANCSGTASGQAIITVTTPATPVITTAQSVPVGGTGAASVNNNAGSTYNWTLTGGTITSGQGTSLIQFTPGSPGTRMTLTVTETNGGCTSAVATKRAMVDFLDVPPSHLFHDFIIKLAINGITGGCGGGNYCPSDAVLRSQMAVFILRGIEGEAYAPPAATGIFADVPIPSFFADFIEGLYNAQITGGCATNPLRYCPGNSVLRSQMAIFLLRAKYGGLYVPPPAVGIFNDVPVGSFAADFIEKLFNDGVTGGCSTNPPLYCPNDATTRGAMAVFLVRTFNLQ